MTSSHLLQPQCSKRSTMKIDLPVFKSTDENANMTYNNWYFDIQQHRLNHTDESLLPHVYQSLQGFPGELAHSLKKVPSLDDLLAKLDDYFRVVEELDAMNRHLYTIKEGTQDGVAEFAMRLCCQIRAIQGKYPWEIPEMEESEIKRAWFLGRLWQDFMGCDGLYQRNWGGWEKGWLWPAVENSLTVRKWGQSQWCTPKVMDWPSWKRCQLMEFPPGSLMSERRTIQRSKHTQVNRRMRMEFTWIWVNPSQGINLYD